MLPALLGAGRALLGSTVKNAVKNKAFDTAKNFVTGKGKKKKGGALVKREGTEITQNKAIVKPSQTYMGKTVSGGSLRPERAKVIGGEGGKVSYEKLTQRLDNIIGVTSALDKVVKAQYSQKENNAKKRFNERQKAKREGREGQLEKGSKVLGVVGGVVGIAKKFNIFDYLLNTLLGGLAALFIQNFDGIKSFFGEFGESFENRMSLLKWGITALANPFKSTTKALVNVFKPAFKVVGKGIAKGIDAVGSFLSKAFGKLGTGVYNFAKNIVKKINNAALTQGAKAAAKGATSATKGVTSIFSRGVSRVPQRAAIKLFGKEGAKRLGLFSKAFKRIPVVGALIGIGIDLAMGESLDRAVIGAIGASLGSTIGAFIGQGLIPIPFVGAGVGALVGAGIGDWAAKTLYGNMAKEIGGQGLSLAGESEITEEQKKEKLQEQREETQRIMSTPYEPYEGTGDRSGAANEAKQAEAIARHYSKSLPPLPPTNTMHGQAYGASRNGGARKHAGVDFDISENEKFYSRIGGEVVNVGNDPGGYGNYVDIYNSQLNVTERIAEGRDVLVKKGDMIAPGQPVVQGETNTGVIHYEIRKGKKTTFGFDNTLNPLDFLKRPESQVEISQKAPSSPAVRTAQSVQRKASYEGGGEQVVVVPAPQPQLIPSVSSGNSGAPIVVGGSTRAMVNSYYKSQLMGFLYKQG